MAYTTIKKPSDYFNTVNYTGTGATQTISGVGHQPDWIWTKGKSAFYEHNLRDSVRGITKKIKSNDTSAEQTNTDGITATNSDGFILGADTAGAGANEVNQSGQNYVAWNWLANGSGSANTDGSISSTVSANTTSGFSIVSYTGTGANATIGHGLGAVPKMMILKKTSSTSDWSVGHASLGANQVLELNKTGAVFTDNTYWNNTRPTSSVLNVGTDGDQNTSGQDYIAYCFADVQGYSKFGIYTGNGNADGTFVYTGFKPAWVVTKVTNTTGSWYMLDNKRDGYNVTTKWLDADSSDAENTSSSDLSVDFLSNGFKARTSNNSRNGSGDTYIYMVFAEEPLVGDNPATAR